MIYKGYNIVTDEIPPMLVIKSKGSGKVPVILSGKYTSSDVAQKAVDLYLIRLHKRKPDAKTKSSNTG